MPSAFPLVSIIVPVYNVEGYLNCCLRSILAQTWLRFEVILVEDCSTDGSLGQIESWLADPRVRLIRHSANAGLSAARNTGIAAATGDYIMFVDSDDAIAPGLAEACVTATRETGAEVIVYDFAPFLDGHALPDLDIAPSGLSAQVLERADYFEIPHFAWLKFIRTGLLLDGGIGFPPGCHYEDWLFHWDLGFRAARIASLPMTGVAYRQRGSSITGLLGAELLDMFVVQEKVLAAVRSQGTERDIAAFVNKVYAGFWSVLTRVDRSLLDEAIARARDLRHSLSAATGRRAQGGRAAVMHLVLGVPAPLAGGALRLLRSLKRLVAVALPALPGEAPR